jgi:single-strand DNA-binding protein
VASSFNRVILAGNMTRDPEARALPSGQALTKFSLAVNRAYTTKEGEKREEVTYVDIESYGKQAEIKLDQWEDKKTGEKRSRLGVVLENFTFIGGKSQGGEEGGSAPRARGGNDTPSPAPDHGGDDVPF